MLTEFLQNVKTTNPLIHCITNNVTINDCANILLACGASPIMADGIEEIKEITSISKGLYINMGTLNSRTSNSMLVAAKQASELPIPVLLDPVGVGASEIRRNFPSTLMKEITPTVIRGNVSEIKVLAAGSGNTKGVDANPEDKISIENLDNFVVLAKNLAKKTGSIVVISGKIDIVADCNTAYCIYNGHQMMSSVTGTGCQISALICAFIAANPQNHLHAVVAAVCEMGVAGEIAYARMSQADGNASYRNYIIDAIYNMTSEQLEKEAKYEVR